MEVIHCFILLMEVYFMKIQRIAFIALAAFALTNLNMQAMQRDKGGKNASKIKKKQTKYDKKNEKEESLKQRNPQHNNHWYNPVIQNKKLAGALILMIIVGGVVYFQPTNQPMNHPAKHTTKLPPFSCAHYVSELPNSSHIGYQPKEVLCGCSHPIEAKLNKKGILEITERNTDTIIKDCNNALDYVQKNILSKQQPSISVDEIKEIHKQLTGGKSRQDDTYNNVEYRSDAVIVFYENIGQADINKYIERHLSKQELNIYSSILAKLGKLNMELEEFIYSEKITTKERLVLNKLAYFAPPHQEIPKLMKNFVQKLNEKLKQGDDPISIAAYAHQSFVQIHPFADGNGRTGRMLMNICLKFFGLDFVTVLNDVKYTNAVTDQNQDAFKKYLEALINGTSQAYN